MTMLLTRTFRDRCTHCQLGQGRNCRCRDELQAGRKTAGRPKRRISPTEWLWLILTASVMTSLATFWGLGLVVDFVRRAAA